MKATSKRRLDRLTPQEERDVEQSLKEIKEGKAKTVKNVKQLVEELDADQEVNVYAALAHSITYTPTFKRGFKSLSSQDQLRVMKAVEDLSKSEDPRTLGLKKRGQLSNIYAYEVGQRIRLLYDFSNDELILVRVGPHESVYR